MRATLILNPSSGSSPMAVHEGTIEDIRGHILTSLRANGIEPEICETTEEDPGTEMAKRAVAQGAEIVIAAGGDGTLHAVAGALIGTNSKLGIIPMGTMNNIAHSLEIPRDIDKACEIIAHGHTSLIDAGVINGHIFLEVAGIGLEAALFPAAEEIKGIGLFSTFKGVVDGLHTLFTFQPTRFRAVFDGKRQQRFRAIQISVCNSPYYGAHFRFAPNAVMDDGFLDVLIYRNFSKFEYLRHALSISQGKRALGMQVSQRKIKSLQVDAGHPIEIHADGVQKGHTPASIIIRPGVLRVQVSEKIATGPNITTEGKRQARRYQQTKTQELREEKGALNVK